MMAPISENRLAFGLSKLYKSTGIVGLDDFVIVTSSMFPRELTLQQNDILFE